MRSILPQFALVLAVFVGIQTTTEAATVQGNEYMFWGIDADELEIPAGSVITEAALTIQNPS